VKALDRKVQDIIAGPDGRPRSYDVGDFLALEIPVRRPLLVATADETPVMRAKDIVLAYAQRGVGKTWFAASLAVALADGQHFLRWRAPAATPVLYVDGEMPAASLQERLRWLGAADRGGRFLRILSRDAQETPFGSLCGTAAQRAVEAELREGEVLILDNISTLFGALQENEASAWEPVQEWLLALRRRGVTTILIHHAGRGGASARGTSKREDVLDLVVALRKPHDHHAEEGARFDVSFEKSRGVFGAAVEPFEAALKVEGDRATWSTRDSVLFKRMAAMQMAKDGMRPNEIAQDLNIGRATVYRWLKEARETNE
jgi:putative DNA primase/helicase